MIAAGAAQVMVGVAWPTVMEAPPPVLPLHVLSLPLAESLPIDLNPRDPVCAQFREFHSTWL